MSGPANFRYVHVWTQRCYVRCWSIEIIIASRWTGSGRTNPIKWDESFFCWMCVNLILCNDDPQHLLHKPRPASIYVTQYIVRYFVGSICGVCFHFTVLLLIRCVWWAEISTTLRASKLIGDYRIHFIWFDLMCYSGIKISQCHVFCSICLSPSPFWQSKWKSIYDSRMLFTMAWSNWSKRGP